MDKTILYLTDHCRFHLGEDADAWQAWYNDEGDAWQDVLLPHDWSVTLPFSREYSSGTGYLAGGIGWYRFHIDPKEEWKGKRLSIVFDGIYKNSRVWCNSYYLGERPNGYISFSYDITDQFSFEHENIISVRVDRTELSDSRWFTGSGITRKVSLIVEEPIHPVYQGISFTTPEVSPEKAVFSVKSELINTTAQDCHVRLSHVLLDADGAYAAAAISEQVIPAQQTAVFSADGEVTNPRLWSPENPNLYTLVTSIAVSDGEKPAKTCEEPEGNYIISDRTRVGIRSFRFDPDEGFFLNGNSMLIKGVCVHHDAGCLGAAVYKEVWRRRLEKLKDMGCNAIRMSHNPHMPELYDLCDEMGFFVMDEAFDEWEAPKNKWWQGHNVYPPRNQGYYVNFPQWHKQDLTDMIRRDRNHPSIIMWSIGNEIDYPNDPYCHPSFGAMTGNNDANKPAAERMYNPLRPNAERLKPLAAHLASIVKSVDPTRPVTLAAAFPELSAKIGFLDALDVAGFNYKEHLYEENHKAFPKLPFIGSENGHKLSAWKAVTDNKYISGQFLWTGIDYLGEAHGWPIHGSMAGIITTAGFEKGLYYRRQSFWAEKPMIHLAAILPSDVPEGWPEEAPVTENWNYMPGEKVLVKCYTNLPEAELFVNGVSIGTYQKKDDEDCIALTVPFVPGTISARSLDGTVSHTLTTAGIACRVELTNWQPSITPLESDEKLPGDDLIQIEASLHDASGTRVIGGDLPLTVSVSGGRLLGLENGDLADVTDYSSSTRSTHCGQLIIYVLPDGTQEKVTVTVKAEGIPTATIQI